MTKKIKSITNDKTITTNYYFDHFFDEKGVVNFKVNFKKIANLYVRYDKKENMFIVTCGNFYSKEYVKEIVKSFYKKLLAKSQSKNSSHTLFGNEIVIKLLTSPTNKCELIKNELYVKVKNTNYSKTTIRSFVEKVGEKYLIDRTYQLAKILNLELNSVICRWFKNKWGHCALRKKEIALSYQLIKFDKSVIDSVIYHELAHLTYFDHQIKFKELLKSYCPDIKVLEKKLSHQFDF